MRATLEYSNDAILGCVTLFYKISPTVKLALRQLRRFGLAGRAAESKVILINCIALRILGYVR